MKNASGDYTQPTSVDVASALAYATQQNDGTHVLNFDGVGPHVYNPSTYSYLITPTTGWDSGKGASLSAFVNYALTLGQQKATEIGYASLGLSLEQYGVSAVKSNVPGAVALTADESSAFASGDLTPAEVALGQTSPTQGVVNPNDQNPNAPGSVTPHSSSPGGPPGGATPLTSSSSGGTSSGSGGSGSALAAAVDPGVSLAGAGPALAYTGGNPAPIVLGGCLLVAGAWIGRRILSRRRRPREAS
jgi:hypothetical protein